MAQVGSQVVSTVWKLFTASGALGSALGELAENAGVSMAPLAAAQVVSQNVAAEIADVSAPVKYPVVTIYCEQVTNLLTEKFRRFSGKAKLVIETRVSQDRLDGLQQRSKVLADAVTEVLDGNRGDWGQGIYYTGGYQVAYGPIRHGGTNFLQITKTSFEVDASTN
jgi:hypothetical protein